MATIQNIKDALSFPADSGNPITDSARTVGNGALLRLKDAIETQYDFFAETGREPDQNDIARFLYITARSLVANHEHKKAIATLPPGPDLEN